MQEQGLWSSGSGASQRSRQEVSHTERRQSRVQQLKPSTSVGTTVCLLFFFLLLSREEPKAERKPLRISHAEGRNEQSSSRGHRPVFRSSFGSPIKICLRRTVAVGGWPHLPLGQPLAPGQGGTEAWGTRPRDCHQSSCVTLHKSFHLLGLHFSI